MFKTEVFERAMDLVRVRWPDMEPRIAVTLGSGWSEVVEGLDLEGSIDYSELPGLGATGVAGHAGRLVLARLDDLEILIFQGRRHLYEGVDWTPIALPIYIAKEAGVETCLLTNAAGGMAEGMEPGDLMAIEDHINMLGCNPLVGEHDPYWGPRFPDQSRVYDSDLLATLKNTGDAIGKKIHSGVYLSTLGPTFETPAEIRAYRAMGADAVGMSTVPEAILANAAGLKVAGLSFITNLAAGISETPLTHQEVMDVSEREMPKLRRYFQSFFEAFRA